VGRHRGGCHTPFENYRTSEIASAGLSDDLPDIILPALTAGRRVVLVAGYEREMVEQLCHRWIFRRSM
jgi:hypothetical protein